MNEATKYICHVIADYLTDGSEDDINQIIRMSYLDEITLKFQSSINGDSEITIKKQEVIDELYKISLND